MSNIEGIRHQVAAGSRFIEEAPVGDIQDILAKIDLGALLEHLSEVAMKLSGYKDCVLEARTAASAVDKAARDGESMYITAVTGTTSAEAVDMLNGAQTMQATANSVFVRTVSLEDQFDQAASLLSTIRHGLEAADRSVARGVQSANELAVTQLATLNQAEAYGASLG